MCSVNPTTRTRAFETKSASSRARSSSFRPHSATTSATSSPSAASIDVDEVADTPAAARDEHDLALGRQIEQPARLGGIARLDELRPGEAVHDGDARLVARHLAHLVDRLGVGDQVQIDPGRGPPRIIARSVIAATTGILSRPRRRSAPSTSVVTG